VTSLHSRAVRAQSLFFEASGGGFSTRTHLSWGSSRRMPSCYKSSKDNLESSTVTHVNNVAYVYSTTQLICANQSTKHGLLHTQSTKHNLKSMASCTLNLQSTIYKAWPPAHSNHSRALSWSIGAENTRYSTQCNWCYQVSTQCSYMHHHISSFGILFFFGGAIQRTQALIASLLLTLSYATKGSALL
jgi:hypothetical protein